MKKIEELAIEYMSTVTCEETDNLGARHIAQRSFLQGVKEAQAWIHVENELPPETGWENAPYLARTKKEHTIVGFTSGCFHLKGGLCLKPGCVIEWRPINRH